MTHFQFKTRLIGAERARMLLMRSAVQYVVDHLTRLDSLPSPARYAASAVLASHVPDVPAYGKLSLMASLDVASRLLHRWPDCAEAHCTDDLNTHTIFDGMACRAWQLLRTGVRIDDVKPGHIMAVIYFVTAGDWWRALVERERQFMGMPHYGNVWVEAT